MSVYFIQKKNWNWFHLVCPFLERKSPEDTSARSIGIIAEGKKERRREAELRANEMLSEIRFEMEAVDSPFISYLEDF